MTIYVNEASAMVVQARFFRDTGDLSAPASARYLLRDLSNDRIVRDWTALTPAAVIDIPIAASENDFYPHAQLERRFERRALTVQADHGLATQCTNEIEYWVRNLAGITNV